MELFPHRTEELCMEMLVKLEPDERDATPLNTFSQTYAQRKGVKGAMEDRIV